MPVEISGSLGLLVLLSAVFLPLAFAGGWRLSAVLAAVFATFALMGALLPWQSSSLGDREFQWPGTPVLGIEPPFDGAWVLGLAIVVLVLFVRIAVRERVHEAVLLRRTAFVAAVGTTAALAVTLFDLAARVRYDPVPHLDDAARRWDRYPGYGILLTALAATLATAFAWTLHVKLRVQRRLLRDAPDVRHVSGVFQ